MRLSCDALVVGSGISALAYALEVSQRGHRVIIATKRAASEANTRYAQGGIAAVLSPEDSFDAHIRDTLRAGAGLCREDVVEMVVREAPAAIDRLIAYGVNFDPAKEGDAIPYDLGREGGHSHRRVAHAGDITGEEVMRGLLHALEQRPNVEIREDHTAVDLITQRKIEGLRSDPARRGLRSENRCLGAHVLDEATGEVHTVRAKAVLLATGGASKVYLYTSNPDVATGDGVAMAWRVGAEVANMEFIQFHPTCLFHPRAKSFLISEALRGEGGKLQRSDGTRFMEKYHPMQELAPRDIVARAIDAELKRTGDDCVFLDMTHLDSAFLEQRFPNILATCLGFGIDLRKEPIPVVPAAHYVCGGVRCDPNGETNIPGLYVAGEVACTGMHGANRLASNSLLEGAVYGYRAAVAARERYLDAPDLEPDELVDWRPGRAVPSDELVVITQCWDEIRRFMWNYVGIVRTDRRLLRARRRIDNIREEVREFYWNATVSRDLIELRNICTVAELIVDCALRRKESRGLHFTLDYPELSGGHPQDTILRRSDLV
jgi:L-aspartate oxidase